MPIQPVRLKGNHSEANLVFSLESVGRNFPKLDCVVLEMTFVLQKALLHIFFLIPLALKVGWLVPSNRIAT